MENGVKLVIEDGLLIIKMPNGDTIPGVHKLSVRNDADDDRQVFITAEFVTFLD